MYDAIVLGGGPAGVFAALQIKSSKILIFEKSSKILSKLKVSGGGRCNFTNATFNPKELSLNYPRGKKELISAFNQFQPLDMIKWLEEREVKVKIDKDKKAFPFSDSSQTIIDCFWKELKYKKIDVKCNQNIKFVTHKKDYFEIVTDENSYTAKNVILATGDSQDGLTYAKALGHNTIPFIPSLFSFKIEKNEILNLSGISQTNVNVSLDKGKYSQTGDILITHEGFSGPAIINLSSWAAKYLFEKNYKTTLSVNWIDNFSKDEIIKKILKFKSQYSEKKLLTINPFNFPNKLWLYLLKSLDIDLTMAIKNISNKKLTALTEKLHSDKYRIISQSKRKGEFVSCGGIDLKEINFKTMESKKCKNLFFVGELLNIDGITGGYNLQNAWTTGFIAGNFI